MFGKRVRYVLLGISLVLLFTGCTLHTDTSPAIEESQDSESKVKKLRPQTEEKDEIKEDPDQEEEVVKAITVSDMKEDELLRFMEHKYREREVTAFGENMEGVITSIDTDEKIAALTFDACGGPHGSAFDEDLITFLMNERIPATLFMNGRWIEENEKTMKILSKHELFDIENHGYSHKPLSLDGRSAYGIRGTEGIKEVLQEVMQNQKLIFSYTGRNPRYFRSGTAYYDDVTLEVLKDLDLKAVNYDVLGDAGATFNKEQMIRSAGRVTRGSIFLYHMNQPHKNIAEGVKHVVPMLQEMGYSFVKLSDYDEYLK